MNLFKKGQGATEYLLMLAAVLVIVAIAVYYVTSTGGYPAVAVTTAENDSHIRLEVSSGSIASGQWQYSVQTSTGSSSWVDSDSELKAPYVVLDPTESGATYTVSSGTYYVSLKHKSTGHIYFSDQVVTLGS